MRYRGMKANNDSPVPLPAAKVPPHAEDDTLGLHIEEMQNINVDPRWNFSCSSSIFIGIFVWVVIAFFLLGMHYHHVVGVEENERLRPDSATRLSEVPAHCAPHKCNEVEAELFGSILGAHNGVVGFSNCNSKTCISHLSHHLAHAREDVQDPVDPEEDLSDFIVHVNTSHTLVRSGMKWQCVEYARRYWLLAGTPVPAYFGGVDGAEDIYEQLQVAYLLDGTIVSLRKTANGKSGGALPRVGELLIYPRDGEAGEFPYGHVAVIVRVEPDTKEVYIAEQNWDSKRWPAPFFNYSRKLELLVDERKGNYTIVDGEYPILGWVGYEVEKSD